MQFNKELTLVRDTEATVIPAGDTQVIPSGTDAVISQALGGTVTIRTDLGLFRLPSLLPVMCPLVKNWSGRR